MEISTWWKKNIEDLSKGMQQKVQFVATVLHEPELIILDEPFTGFDPINANMLKNEIINLQQAGSTIIFSTHRMESVEELCDHIALINRSKKVLDGSKFDIKERYKANTYILETSNPVQLGLPAFEILEEKSLDRRMVTKVKIHEGGTNELLSAVLPQATVFGMKENIPSMNEVFISIVGEALPMQ
jgi:ABC-2 type transport system ATP-binding protein